MWNPRIKNLIKMVAELWQENYKRLQSIQELCARVEALEAAQQPQLDQSPAPPIGVKPQWLADEERLCDLEAAIKRYEDSGLPVRPEWRKERGEIVARQQQWNQPVMAKDSSTDATPAPAEGLVERVAWRLANQNKDANPEIWRSDARAAIREVAAWLRSELISRAAADRIEQEAER